MIRMPLRAAVVAVALAATGTPVSAYEETTTVSYATELSAYIKTLYRPPLLAADPESLTRGVLDADCKYDATATGNSSGGDQAVAAFVAKVGTTSRRASTNPLDGIPAATGVSCELWESEDNSYVWGWQVLRPGPAAYFAEAVLIGKVRKPKICVTAWVIFSDTSEYRGPKQCRQASLL